MKSFQCLTTESLQKKKKIMNDAVSQDSEGGGVSRQGDKTEK